MSGLGPKTAGVRLRQYGDAVLAEGAEGLGVGAAEEVGEDTDRGEAAAAGDGAEGIAGVVELGANGREPDGGKLLKDAP